MGDLTIADKQLLAEAAVMWTMSSWSRAIVDLFQSYVEAVSSGDIRRIETITIEGTKKVIAEQSQCPEHYQRIRRVMEKIGVPVLDIDFMSTMTGLDLDEFMTIVGID